MYNRKMVLLARSVSNRSWTARDDDHVRGEREPRGEVGLGQRGCRWPLYEILPHDNKNVADPENRVTCRTISPNTTILCTNSSRANAYYHNCLQIQTSWRRNGPPPSPGISVGPKLFHNVIIMFTTVRIPTYILKTIDCFKNECETKSYMFRIYSRLHFIGTHRLRVILSR